MTALFWHRRDLRINDNKGLFEALKQNGVLADWREPNVIRIAPVPLYNTFKEIYHFGEIVKRILF